MKLDAAGELLWSAATSDSSSYAELGVDAAGRPVVVGPRFSLSEPPPPPPQSPTYLSVHDASSGAPLSVEKLPASVSGVVTAPGGGVLVTGALYVGGTLGTGDVEPGGFVLEVSVH